MKVLMIHAPYKLTEPPLVWNPALAVELAHQQELGHTVYCLDNALYRVDVEVLVQQVKNLKADKIIIYGSLPQYQFIKQYLERFPNAKVMGFPKQVLNLPTEDGVIDSEKPSKYPCPIWSLLPIEDYFQNSPPLDYVIETATSKRKAVYQSRWIKGWEKPEKTVENLRYLKLHYNYDFMFFEDDLTQAPKRTEKFLKLLEEYDMFKLFPWSCKASLSRVTSRFLASIREAGCVLIDYGVIDVTLFRNKQFQNLLFNAVHLARTEALTPIIKCSIGYPETTRQDILEATRFLKANNLLHKPTLLEPYPNTIAYKKIKKQVSDVEKHILEINQSFVNYTRWTDIELLGIAELMKRGNLEKLERSMKNEC